MKTLKAIDLFAGVGGTATGLKASGFNVLSVEQDNFTCENYRLNHGQSIIEGDVSVVDPHFAMDNFELKKYELDLLSLSPPCQSFSNLVTKGKAVDMSDERTEMTYASCSWIKKMMPKLIMLENVPPFARSDVFVNFSSFLEELGYFVSSSIVDCSKYRVPQARKRLVMLASRVGEVSLPHPYMNPITVRDAIGGLPDVADSNDSLHQLAVKHTDEIAAFIEKLPIEASLKDYPHLHAMPCRERNRNIHFDVYSRMRWDMPAPTIIGKFLDIGSGRFIHPEKHRGLTLREGAILQSFPKNYKFDLSRGNRVIGKMVGNAFPPLAVQEICSKLKDDVLE